MSSTTKDQIVNENRDLRVQLSSYCLTMNKERELFKLKQEQLLEDIRHCQKQEVFWRQFRKREISERKTTGCLNTAAENRRAFREHILREMRSTAKDESGVRLEEDTERGTPRRYEENSPLLISKYQHYPVKTSKQMFSTNNMTENSNEKRTMSPSSKVNLFLPNSSIDTKTGSADKSAGAFNSITRALFKHESNDNSKAVVQKSFQAVSSDIAMQTEEAQKDGLNSGKTLHHDKSTQTATESSNFVLGIASKACQTDESAMERSDKVIKSSSRCQKSQVKLNKKQKIFFNTTTASKSKMENFINISDLFSVQSKTAQDILKMSKSLKSPQIKDAMKTRSKGETSTKSSGCKRSGQRDSPLTGSVSGRLTYKDGLMLGKTRQLKQASLVFNRLLPVISSAELVPKIVLPGVLPAPL